MKHTKFSGILKFKLKSRSRDSQQQKKRICLILNFAVPVNHKVKIKENETRDKNRELKMLWKMNMTLIPIVIGELETIRKGLVKKLEDLEIRGQVKTIQTTDLSK